MVMAERARIRMSLAMSASTKNLQACIQRGSKHTNALAMGKWPLGFAHPSVLAVHQLPRLEGEQFYHDFAIIIATTGLQRLAFNLITRPSTASELVLAYQRGIFIVPRHNFVTSAIMILVLILQGSAPRHEHPL